MLQCLFSLGIWGHKNLGPISEVPTMKSIVNYLHSSKISL